MVSRFKGIPKAVAGWQVAEAIFLYFRAARHFLLMFSSPLGACLKLPHSDYSSPSVPDEDSPVTAIVTQMYVPYTASETFFALILHAFKVRQILSLSNVHK